jgi:OmpA-OmpF porin, OOP family
MSGNKTLWWTILVGWIAGCVYWHVCGIRQLCDAPLGPLGFTERVDTDSVAQVPIKSAPLRITDSSGLNLVASGNFRFARSGFVPDIRLVTDEMDSLARYLLSFPSKLTISGAYLSDETNKSPFPNLGLARANEIRMILVKAGLPEPSIQLNFQKDLLLTPLPDSDSMSGGIQFLIEVARQKSEIDLARAEKFRNIFEPMDLYFPTASTIYIKTAENEKFLLEARKYLESHNDKRIRLTGHTDDEDSAEWNLILSRKRAESVKRQFVDSGINAARIVAGGKGEIVPKASNSTSSGRRANRRVTIVVQ